MRTGHIFYQDSKEASLKTLDLTVLSPEKEIFKGEATSVAVSTLTGDIEIFPLHAATLSVIAPGHLTINREGQDPLKFFVSGGYVDVAGSVNIISDKIIDVADADAAFMQAEKERYQDILNKADDKISDQEFERASDHAARYEQLVH